jgi:hypothetical protein
MTADTFSNTLGYTIMGTGNDNNTWGSIANANVFQIFEDAIANFLTSAVTGGTLDLSGTPPPTGVSQVRYGALIFTGALGSDQTLQVPNLTKFWWVNNQTSGAHLLKIKTPSGAASSAIPQNSGWQLVICDGANNIIVTPFNSQQIQMPDGAVGAPPFSFLNEPTSGWYRAAAGDARLSILGADKIKATAAGLFPPSGIVGVTNGSDAAAGIVGEYLSVAQATPVPMTSGVVTNICTLSLTAGDWDAQGDFGGLVSPSDSGVFMAAGLSTTSATFPVTAVSAFSEGLYDFSSGGAFTGISGLRVRFSLSGTTTIYLVARINDTGASGVGQIQARRVR